MDKSKRKPLIAGNWKMNGTYGAATVLVQQISNLFEKDWLDTVDVVICPPFIDLKPALSVLEFDKVNICVGAQNVYWEESGAFTGEISVNMIRDLGCGCSIVGHSERRSLFGETNEDVNKKVRALVADKRRVVYPIICVGESLALREEGTYLDYINKQVDAAFAGMDSFDVDGCVVAYEPIWAIGTGRTATPEQAQEVCHSIRCKLAELFGDDTAQSMRILYGGSMNEGNAELLLSEDDIDGGLIGSASLNAKSFINIIKAAL